MIALTDSRADPPDGIEVSASMVSSTINETSTASVRTVLRNTETGNSSVFTGPNPPFSTEESQNGGWMLVHPDTGLEKKSKSCWEPSSDTRLGNSDLLYEHELESGQTIEQTYELWGSPYDDRCMPAGEYTFSNEYQEVENQSEFEWTLTFAIDKTE